MQPVKIKQGVAGPIYKLNLPMLLQKSITRLPAHEEASFIRAHQQMKKFPYTWLNISAHEIITEYTVDLKNTELWKLRHIDFIELKKAVLKEV